MSVIPLRKAEREEEEAVASPAAGDEPNRAEARGRASSIPKLPFAALPLPFRGAPDSDAPSPAAQAADVVRRRLAGLTSVPVIRRQPDHLERLWARHREAAQRHEGALLKDARYAWGVLHVAVWSACLVVLSVAFSPGGFVLAVAVAAACWFWLL